MKVGDSVKIYRNCKAASDYHKFADETKTGIIVYIDEADLESGHQPYKVYSNQECFVTQWCCAGDLEVI